MTPPTDPENGSGRSFRRTRAAIVVGALAGTLACFTGIAPAMASAPVGGVVQTHSLLARSAVPGAGSTAAPSPATVKADLRAYLKARYTYADALDLAVVWGAPSRAAAKVAGGAKILHGVAMPFAPKGGFARQYTAAQQRAGYALSDYQGDFSEALRLAEFWGTSTVVSAKAKAGTVLLANKALPAPKTFTAKQDASAFALAGYTPADALDLAVVWGSPSRAAAQVTAGATVLRGKALPFVPKAGFARQYTAAQQRAGYALSDYQGEYYEALRMAALWGLPTVASAKSKAGAVLLANKALPVPKTFTAQQDVSAFALAGYTTADALKLATLWHSVSPQAAKVKAGRDLLSVPRVVIPLTH